MRPRVPPLDPRQLPISLLDEAQCRREGLYHGHALRAVLHEAKGAIGVVVPLVTRERRPDAIRTSSPQVQETGSFRRHHPLVRAADIGIAVGALVRLPGSARLPARRPRGRARAAATRERALARAPASAAPRPLVMWLNITTLVRGIIADSKS